ncbi:histidine biosynthesis protein [Proteiniclasticum sp. SCR006]|uniref:Histidine biosynthesis protein n=1 Tax=Proteiniclasticum aestuarii TaxID=2817862 RepID=A0A939HA20_9CLOT|nr:histidine biosynthesis protein [Proteiniclasticum aestuarii]MBO1264157.1 histidine biosynthesis protein [Proteiniclasticum aestuarii]
MIKSDMELKRKKALKKVTDAIELHNGTTILSTGITGDDARLAKAAVDGGARMLEPNHPALALARGYKGVNNMHDAEMVRHEISLDQMLESTSGVRNVVGQDIFITVGVPGGFTEVMPVELSDEDFKKISLSGADGLHTHKSSLEDLKIWVEKAHRYGLLVDAYIGHPNDLHTFGIAAETPEDVSIVAKKLEEIGVDMIGLMTGMSYEGVKAGEIPEIIEKRVRALVSSVSVPTLAEGGINKANFHRFKELGINILVVGTSIDNVVTKAASDTVKKFLER